MEEKTIRYMKCNPDNIVWDLIDFPHEDYVEVQTPRTLPLGILAGWWRWVGGEFVYDPDLYNAIAKPDAPVPPPDSYLLAQADTRILELEYENILLKEGITV